MQCNAMQPLHSPQCNATTALHACHWTHTRPNHTTTTPINQHTTLLPWPPGLTSRISTGLGRLQERMVNMWQQMGSKDPNTLQKKIYDHGQKVIENMSAEERLMRNIPKAATKVGVVQGSQ